MSILVIDDDTESRALLSRLLIAEGFRVRAVDSGERALTSLSADRPELVLLDIRMPGMDGFEVCRRLKEVPDIGDIPVIFLSASSAMADRLQCFRLGAVDFISLPFEREELLARVRTHLELSRLRHQLEDRVAERTAALRESEERFRAIADAAPVMMWTSSLDKSCDFVNQRWLEFTGHRLEEEQGDGWANSLHPEDRERCWETYASAFDARRAFEMEYRLRGADGEYAWVLDRGVARSSPDGVFLGYIGCAVDITDFKQANQRLLASQKFETLGAMAAGVAHDFGNLLGTVLVEADLALSELTPDSRARENLERLVKVAARGTEIVDLLMASAGACKKDAVLERLDLAAEAANILRLLKHSISKRATVHSSLPGNLPMVLGKTAEIYQVLLNLVTNASDALGDRPGSISISIDQAHLKTPDPALGLSAGDYVRLRVADTGCGMSVETRAQIFDPFFTTKPKGRGLGLAAVHGIVLSCGGAMSVESAPGAGSEFEVWFPCVACAALTAGQAR